MNGFYKKYVKFLSALKIYPFFNKNVISKKDQCILHLIFKILDNINNLDKILVFKFENITLELIL